jgi:hypothetical protein
MTHEERQDLGRRNRQCGERANRQIARRIQKHIGREYIARVGCQAGGQWHIPDVGIYLRAQPTVCLWHIEVKSGPVCAKAELRKVRVHAAPGAIPALVYRVEGRWLAMAEDHGIGEWDWKGFLSHLRRVLCRYEIRPGVRVPADACPVCDRVMPEKLTKEELKDRLREGIRRLEGKKDEAWEIRASGAFTTSDPYAGLPELDPDDCTPTHPEDVPGEGGCDV